MQVEVRALPTSTRRAASFSSTSKAMRRAGLGALYEAFERLKAKLEAKGLFAERKRAIPRFPRASVS